MFFIHSREVPQYIKVNYLCIVCDIQPQKKGIYWVHITVGTEKSIDNGPVSTPTADLMTAKVHWNSVLSTPNAKYLIVEVKNFYLNNPINNKEFHKKAINLTPQ